MKGLQFEIENKDFSGRGAALCPNEFITVLDEFKHHYTGETMRYIRVERSGYVTGSSVVEYQTVNEIQFNILWAKCIKVWREEMK